MKAVAFNASILCSKENATLNLLLEILHALSINLKRSDISCWTYLEGIQACKMYFTLNNYPFSIGGNYLINSIFNVTFDSTV